MYDHNQLDVPDSFVALFLSRGRLQPGATREQVSARYEWCEDLAQHLLEYARAQHHDAGLAQIDVLERCQRGLLAGTLGVSEAEVGWVVRRLAELAEWPARELGPMPETG